MSDILVTCGFTTFNSEKTINLALKSALEQDYKDIEILIVDDNSSDCTINKIHSFLSQKEINYRLIKHSSNLGVAEARNSLLKNAKGEFLAFFDSDDISYSNRISHQVSRIKEFEVKYLKKNSSNYRSPLCYCDREIFFENKVKIYCKAMHINIIDFSKFREKIISSLLFCNSFPKNSDTGSTATCMLCARIKTLKALNGFNPTLRRYEDLDLTIRAIMQKIPICKINKSLVKQYYKNREYKKNEYIYEKRLIYIHRNWLKKKNLYKIAFYFVSLKKSILNFKIRKSLYYFFILFIHNPSILYERIISSFNTLFFTIKTKKIKNKF